MTLRASALAIFLSALSATAATAQDRGTQAEQDACTPDVMNLCSDYIPDEGPIVACLKAHRSQLSVACRQVFFPGSARRDR